MDGTEQRAALQALIDAGGHDYAGLSRLLDCNPAYIQQYMKRGSPRLLPEQYRRRLARFFGVADSALGGEGGIAAETIAVPHLAVAASAGPGAFVEGEAARGITHLARQEVPGIAPEHLSYIRVTGDSMSPTLFDGDEILVDATPPIRVREGLWVMTVDDTLMVKRLKRQGRGWTVASDNPDEPDPGAFDAARMELKGRVVRSVRRFR
ncbi:S24 family peptidase [Sphingomonas gilva]|uniref:S24 family peptidase n=1 Tax=Sphingomonas gilva TaxID=2305907 RepID=A0A396S508_9SPHN|nr:S24 family peptidase [Sphingomonas gilva]RHW18505.1 S24 family peptidase [Sphingomonas gilva]